MSKKNSIDLRVVELECENQVLRSHQELLSLAIGGLKAELKQAKKRADKLRKKLTKTNRRVIEMAERSANKS